MTYPPMKIGQQVIELEMQFAGHSVFDYGFNDVARCWVASAGDSATT